jgi:hypothetical protein
MELFNETIITLITYSIMCFTDFVPKPNNRYELGYVSIALICIHFVVNISILLKTNAGQIIAVFKRYLVRIQDLTARKKSMIQKLEKQPAK